MDKQAIFAAWVPPEGVWSPWAKPVLFAHLPRSLVQLSPSRGLDLSWLPRPEQQQAIIVDLPGREAVEVGIALAQRGFRPVPLFKACPLPNSYAVSAHISSPEAMRRATLVDVESILAALVAGVDRLRRLQLRDNAPPAFLLDSDRQGRYQLIHNAVFDNRSVVFPGDFPSPEFLRSQGIEGVLVLRWQDRRWQELTPVLQRFQTGELTLHYKLLSRREPIQPLKISASLIWVQKACFAVCRPRQNREGEFGKFLTDSASAG